MPRYFFDLYNDIDVADGEGKELPGIDAARDHALCEAREMLAESAGNGRIDLNHCIEVRDEAGAIVHRVRFGDAVEVVPQR